MGLLALHTFMNERIDMDGLRYFIGGFMVGCYVMVMFYVAALYL
jgi:hypothetical protein